MGLMRVLERSVVPSNAPTDPAQQTVLFGRALSVGDRPERRMTERRPVIPT
jgi:hypothetical protein